MAILHRIVVLASACAAMTACTGISGLDDLALGGEGADGKSSASAPTGTTRDSKAASPESSDRTGAGEAGVNPPPSTPPEAPPAVPTPPPTPSKPVVAFGSAFDSNPDCAAWTPTNGGTRAFDSPGHTAAGSCRLCAPTGGTVEMARTWSATTNAQHRFGAWARVGAGAIAGFSFAVQKNGGLTVSAGQGFNPGGAWTSFTGVALAATSGDSFAIKIGMVDAAPGDCILVDDVAATLE